MVRFFSFLLFITFFFAACNTAVTGLYEDTKSFSKHEWHNNDSISFTFKVTDTLHPYQMFFVLRHDDAYHFKNIWVDITVKDPDTVYTVKRDFKLADNEKWFGTGIGNTFEHRIPFSNTAHYFKAGVYTFTVKQIMREEPLQNIIAAGIRMQKTE